MMFPPHQFGFLSSSGAHCSVVNSNAPGPRSLLLAGNGCRTAVALPPGPRHLPLFANSMAARAGCPPPVVMPPFAWIEGHRASSRYHAIGQERKMLGGLGTEAPSARPDSAAPYSSQSRITQGISEIPEGKVASCTPAANWQPTTDYWLPTAAFVSVTCQFSLAGSASVRHNTLQRNTPDEAATNGLEPLADQIDVAKSK